MTTGWCRAVDGVRHAITLTAVGDVTSSSSTLPARTVSIDGGPTVLRKWVPRTPAGEPGPLGSLSREIQALHHFAMTFAPEAYPVELPRLRYYDVDGAEPFVLLDPYRGVPVAEALPQLAARDRYRLQVGVLRALHLTGIAGMTHGRVDLNSIRWDADSGTVQLVDFERAVPIGGQRVAGNGRAGIRDDMWDAGLAIWRTVHPTHLGPEAPDLTEAGSLGVLLAGVFANSPDDRPTPQDLLARLGEPARTDVIDLGARFATGLQAFDSALRSKRDRRQEREALSNRLRSVWSRFRGSLHDRRRLLLDGTAPEASVRCPVCLDSYPLLDDGLWRQSADGQYEQIWPVSEDQLKGEVLRSNAYIRCPNPAQDTAEHYLPANYFAHDSPLVVAMVGQPTAGKTHLLAAMIREIVERDGLAPYGLTVAPMDLHRHHTYRTTILDQARRGVRLPRTPGNLTDPADILRVSGKCGTRPLVFFDVAGEDLAAVGDGALARFLLGVDAVIFVHGLEPAPERHGNHALEMSLARLQTMPDLERLPAAIVVTKSDRLRYHPPVSHWLPQGHDRHVSVETSLVHRESRDVYAFLHQRHEFGALAPFTIFDRCTLHFVSASGSEAAPDRGLFPRGFEPSRVLRPLVAILAMAGMLEGDQMRHVGT